MTKKSKAGVLKAKVNFSWAHRGVEIKEYAKGEVIETDDEDLIRVSLEEGWTEPVTGKASPAPSPSPTPAPPAA